MASHGRLQQIRDVRCVLTGQEDRAAVGSGLGQQPLDRAGGPDSQARSDCGFGVGRRHDDGAFQLDPGKAGGSLGQRARAEADAGQDRAADERTVDVAQIDGDGGSTRDHGGRPSRECYGRQYLRAPVDPGPVGAADPRRRQPRPICSDRDYRCDPEVVQILDQPRYGRRVAATDGDRYVPIASQRPRCVGYGSSIIVSHAVRASDLFVSYQANLRAGVSNVDDDQLGRRLRGHAPIVVAGPCSYEQDPVPGRRANHWVAGGVGTVALASSVGYGLRRDQSSSVTPSLARSRIRERS